MRNRRNFLIAVLCFIGLTTFAQIEVEETEVVDKESTTQGIFVKNGKQKIDALECYDFKDLIVSFDIKKEYFTYDRVTILLHVGDPENISYATEFSFGVNKDDFYNLFNGKKYAYFKVFSSADLDEESLWRNGKEEPLTRARLQYCKTKKELTNSKIGVEIRCGRITGTKTVHDTRTDGTIVSRNVDVWKWITAEKFNIDLKNRIKMKLTDILQSIYPKVTSSGNCYN